MKNKSKGESMDKFDDYLELGIKAKREGRYKEAIYFYDAAYELTKSNLVSIKGYYDFFKAYGKINFILEDYEKSCYAYKCCIETLKRWALQRGESINSPQYLYDMDYNTILHFGYAILALNKFIDSVTIDTYRRNIDPYYNNTAKAVYGEPIKEADDMAINVAMSFVIKNMPEIFERT